MEDEHKHIWLKVFTDGNLLLLRCKCQSIFFDNKAWVPEQDFIAVQRERDAAEERYIEERDYSGLY